MNHVINWDAFPRIKSSSVRAHLLFGGDFCPLRRFEPKILSGQDIFDDNLKNVFKNNDFSIVNLEAPLCATSLKADNPSGYGLRLAPQTAAFIELMQIDAVGIANNHIRDFGDAGVIQTMDNLKKTQLLFAGAGRNLKEAERILSVTINGLKVGLWVLAEKELNTASEYRPGTSWFRPELDAMKIKRIKNNYDFLAIYLHAGHEFMLTPSPRMRRSCRALIAAGADAVIAHHPHVPQGIEKYGHGLIAYSLGNLVFDSDYVSAHEYTDLGYLLELDIGRHSINAVKLIPHICSKDLTIRSMTIAEIQKFRELLLKISANIVDDAQFFKEWDRNVKWRWQTDYKNLFQTFPEKIGNPAYCRNLKNLFICPTGQEIVEHCFDMLEQGLISSC